MTTRALAGRLARWLRARRQQALLAAVVVVPALGLLVLDGLFPVPLPQTASAFSRLIVAGNGAPLRAFADQDGVWRYPVKAADVSPLYLQALIAYEDRHFWRHPGVNPLAMGRAAWQSLREGRLVSGGSTLTMQLARLLDPHPRSVLGKAKQVARALQLEWHLSKQRILNHYLNFAPFGGPLEGVEAAGYAYLGKSAKELSHAEAALLVILPQAPSRLRPDRFPERARRARDKVLRRMQALGLWSARTVSEAMAEPVITRFESTPSIAPLLARRLLSKSKSGEALRTTIDYGLQLQLEARLASLAANLPARTSVALLIVENASLSVRAYVGSVAYADATHYGYLDMVRAVRSPGSTLKPFLYGFAVEDGLIHSESLLSDVPLAFGAYRPANFDGQFNGPVGVSEALRRSLNVPAVQLLSHLKPERFVARLARGGLKLHLPPGARPNPTLILGGAGSTLEDLVAAFASLARGGVSGKLRLTEDSSAAPRYFMSAGAAWIVRHILSRSPRPGLNGTPAVQSDTSAIAWKTGTSYGYRDAWSLGVDARHTVGVWVGRPDGTPMPGHYGAVTAAPIMFSIFDMLPAELGDSLQGARPGNVSEMEICLPLGTPPEAGREQLCHLRRRALVLDGVTPRTLPDSDATHWQGLVRRVWINPASGRRVTAACRASGSRMLEIVQWPLALHPWLSRDILARSAVPALDDDCATRHAGEKRSIRISGIADGVELRRGADGTLPRVSLKVLGAADRAHWLVDGRPEQSGAATGEFIYRFATTGLHRVTAVDDSGSHSSVSVRVH